MTLIQIDGQPCPFDRTTARHAIVINCSSPRYNLGARKLADWLKSQAISTDYHDGDPGLFGLNADLVCLSVIFSWHAPRARDIALRFRGRADVWAGGPGLYALGNWWQRETGLTAHRGLDWRFERQRGDYQITFASRGCPVNCSFCIVSRIEGTAFTLDWDFLPAPILCDNNLSALPVEFQEHIIQRYQETGTHLMDANSGFEPRTFDEDTYRRWRPVIRGPWRFAFDELSEAEDVHRMMDILRQEPSRRKQVYVLIGNEPISACHERVLKVLEWGGEPYCQPLLDLNYLGGPIRVRHDWSEQQLRDFARWANRHLWRYCNLAGYHPRRYESPPFGARMAGMGVS